MRNLIYIFCLLSFFYCKPKESQKIEGKKKKTFYLTKKKDLRYSDSILSKIKEITKSGYYDHSEEVAYKKNNKDVFILIYEDFENFKLKGIGYSITHEDDKKYYSTFYHFSELDEKNVLSVYESYDYDKEDEDNHKNKVIDSIFLKDNKIVLWKNKQVTQKEMLEKEKEILAIKREIDSVLKD